ncbi:MAG TPA: type II toxin-antitoxin system VapC family toxin [Candidatus Thermoplasmatota archaeon]|jgi:predicted nucleic acid-binding protein|nr:type II toxin-antitoxin system VapC family toxin [Candidatus Thermoplasmatota archaeon]
MIDVALDASVGIRIVADDEDGHDAALDAYDRLVTSGFNPIACDLYVYEVGNALSRSRSKRGRAERLLEACELVEVHALDPDGLMRALAWTERGKLTFYDAAHLALAESRGALLWTEDQEILRRSPEAAVDTEGLLLRLG